MSVQHAHTASVRLYDRLFNVETPANEEGDYKQFLNPDSLVEVPLIYIEPALTTAKTGMPLQFLRKGYFCVDEDSTDEKIIFNRTVSLKDTWAKEVKKG